MNGYLLDTDTASAMVRSPRGRVAAKAAGAGRHLAVSLITAAELRFGVARVRGERWETQVRALLARFPVLPLESPVDVFYADLRAALAARGTPIGANDLWLAAHALALDRVLVTGNTREFHRVPGLRIENWNI